MEIWELFKYPRVYLCSILDYSETIKAKKKRTPLKNKKDPVAEK